MTIGQLFVVVQVRNHGTGPGTSKAVKLYGNNTMCVAVGMYVDPTFRSRGGHILNTTTVQTGQLTGILSSR